MCDVQYHLIIFRLGRSTSSTLLWFHYDAYKDATLIITEQQNVHHSMSSTFIFQSCYHVAVSPTHDETTCEIL